MKWCDFTPSIQEWGSEEIIIPYISPVDGKRHRYFPDFYVKIQNRKYLVEVKPFRQTMEPKTQKTITKIQFHKITARGMTFFFFVFLLFH